MVGLHKPSGLGTQVGRIGITCGGQDTFLALSPRTDSDL